MDESLNQFTNETRPEIVLFVLGGRMSPKSLEAAKIWYENRCPGCPTVLSCRAEIGARFGCPECGRVLVIEATQPGQTKETHMGLQADAVALAELTGKGVKECKKALKGAGNSLRNMTIEEKAQALSWSQGQAAPEERKTVEAPPAPPPLTLADVPEPKDLVSDEAVADAVIPPIEKAIDPEPEPQVKDAPEIAPQVPKAAKKTEKASKKKAKKKTSKRTKKIVETNDSDDMGGKIKDEAS